MKRIKIGLFFAMLACLGLGALTACKENPPESTGNGNNSTSESPSVDLVELQTYEANIQTGETVQIEVLNWNGNITFTSQNSNIATVDENGLVSGIADGTAVIEVVCGEDTLIFIVNVAEALKGAVNFRLATDSAQIYVGYQLTLSPILTIGGQNEAVSNYSVVYQSSNANIAAVEAGVVTGIAEGEVVIKAIITIDGVEYETTANLNVIEISVVTLDKDAVTLSKEGTFQEAKLSYTYKKYEQGSFVETESPTPVWTSSNEGIVTVDGDGNLSGISAGTATITLVCGKASAACEVTVREYYAKIFDVNGFLDIGNHLNGYFELMNDIDCSGIVFENPFGYVGELDGIDAETKINNYDSYSIPFTGSLNGNGYSIRNLSHVVGVGDERFERAIFARVGAEGIIENIGFDVVNANSTAVMAAGITCINYGTIRNVAVNMTLSGIGTSFNQWGTAGIANLNYGKVSSCVVNVQALNGVKYAGTVCLGGIINTNRGGKVSSSLALVNSDEVLVVSHTGSWGTVSGCAVTDSTADIVNVFDKALLSSAVWNTTGDVLPVLKTEKQTVISDKIVYTGLNGNAGIRLEMEESETILSVSLNGKDIPYTVQNNLIVVSPDELSGETNDVDTLIVQTDAIVYLFQVKYFALEVEMADSLEYDKSVGGAFTISLAGIEGDIESVNINGVSVEYTVEAGKVSIAADVLTEFVGEIVLSIHTKNATYKYSACLVTKYLNAENVTSWATLKSIIESDMNGYYVLTSDINLAAAGNNSQRSTRAIGFGAVSGTSHTGYTEFNGTIDGRGYAIQNLEYNWRADGGNHDQSLFDVIGAKGVVKNLALTNVKVVVSGVRIAALAWTNKGTIENCYVDYTNTAGVGGQNAEWGQAVMVLINEGTIKDSITKLTTTASTGTNRLSAVTAKNTGTVSNVNSIVSIISDVDPVSVFVDNGATANSACYTDVTAFYTANGDSGYTSSYWTFDETNTTVSFGGTVVLE